ncbi:MAG: IPTL-CTERM sorting domain-containing protein [Planctomycetota bacterium]
MKGSSFRTAVLRLVLTVGVAGICASEASAGYWVYTGAGWKYFDFDTVMPTDPPVDELYCFSSASIAQLDNPEQPPMVLGDTGPWDVSLTATDPNGVPMAHPGVKFTLQGGGVPLSSDNSAWVVNPFETPDPFVLGELTVFFVSSGAVVTTYTDLPPPVYPIVPPELTDPEEIYQYIIDMYLEQGIPTVSQWGLVIMTLLLLTTGAVLMRRRKAGRAVPAKA